MTAPPGGPQDKELQKLIKGLSKTVTSFASVVEKMRSGVSIFNTSITKLNKSVTSVTDKFDKLNKTHLKNLEEKIRKTNQSYLKTESVLKNINKVFSELDNRVKKTNQSYTRTDSILTRVNKSASELEKSAKKAGKNLSEIKKVVPPKPGVEPKVPTDPKDLIDPNQLVPKPDIQDNNNDNDTVDFNTFFGRQQMVNQKQYEAFNRIFAGFGANVNELGGSIQEFLSRDPMKNSMAAFQTTMLMIAETLVDAITRSDVIEKKALSLGRNIQSVYEENSQVLKNLAGDSIENLAVTLELYSLGIRENSQGLQQVANRVRLTGGDYKQFARSMAGTMVALQINARQAGDLAKSLEENSIQNGIAIDDLVRSVAGLSKDLKFFASKGMGSDIAAALGKLQAEAGAASEDNIKAFAETMLNSDQGLAIAAQAGVLPELMALGTKQGATEENLKKITGAVGKVLDRQVDMFDNAVIAGIALKGSIFEAMVPIKELDTSIKNMSEQQKHREKIDREFTNTLATINEELLNPIKEFVVKNFESIKLLGKVAGHLIKWAVIIGGVAAIMKAAGWLMMKAATITQVVSNRGILGSIGDTLKDVFIGKTSRATGKRASLGRMASLMARKGKMRMAAAGGGMIAKLLAGAGPVLFGMGKFLAKGLLRFIPFVGTALLAFDVLKMGYDWWKGTAKNTEKTAYELELERQRKARLERQQTETISTLDKTMIALINVTRNKDAAMNTNLEIIAKASSKTASNTNPKPTPPMHRREMLGN